MTLEKSPIIHAYQATAAVLGTNHLATKKPTGTHLGIHSTTSPSVVNWGGNKTCQPKKMFYPKSVADCQAILLDAREKQLPVRCIGVGHSWSSVAMCEDGYLLSTTQMSAVQEPKLLAGDANSWSVTVQPGVLVHDLDQKLREHNPPLALPTAAVCAGVSVGGMVSTGSYGTMTNERSVSDLIHEITLLNSSGELCHFSPAKDQIEFSAVICSLGLMGILCEITLKLVPMTNNRMAIHDRRLNLRTLFPESNSGQALKKTVLEADGTEILYWPPETLLETPMNPNVWVKQFRLTDRPLMLTQNRMLEVHHPLFSTFKVGELVKEIPDALHFSMGDEKTTVVESGVVFKCNDDFSNVVECFNMLLHESCNLMKDAIIEMRFIRASKAMMSPLYDRDPSALLCCVNLMAVSGTQGFEQFAIHQMSKLMDRYHAIPHWAKLWEDMPEVKKKLRDLYGDRLMQFDHIRRKYDIHGIFLNNTFHDML